MFTLILGGIRSGKSAFALHLAQDAGVEVAYLATGLAEDEEMRQRIEAHRRLRPAEMKVIEEPLMIGSRLPAGPDVVLLESVDGWLANRLSAERDPELTDPEALFEVCREELELLIENASHLVAVSSEVGLSLVSTNRLGRIFVDCLGTINQWLAARADTVVFVAAGLPWWLKGTPAQGAHR